MCNRKRISGRGYLCAAFCFLHLWVIGEESRGASDFKDPNAADLVRAVRESENWIHTVDSFYLRIDSKWTTPPHPNLPEDLKCGRPFKSGTTDTMEFAFDNKRVREMQDRHGESYSLQIWDGKQFTDYNRSRSRGQETYYRERFYLDSTLQRHFHQLIASSSSWPRAQPHSFWFDEKDVEKILIGYGKSEDFVLAGRSEYRGVDCYVLEFDQSGLSERMLGRVKRWYVGVKDRLLYGKVRLRHGKLDGEHWALDYKEVAKDSWLPMTQGYEHYRLDGEGKPYLYTRRDLKVVEVRVNEQLADELFEVELKEGVEVADNRSGRQITYIYKAPLVGKALPDSNGIDIDFTGGEMRGNLLLICFFDIEQRPSRHMVRELTKQEDKFKEKGVVVVCVQASKVDRSKLDEWVKENKISFDVGMIEGDEEKVRFEWGVKSLPWLVLTDKKHIVRAEGFGIEELDEKIQEKQIPSYPGEDKKQIKGQAKSSAEGDKYFRGRLLYEDGLPAANLPYGFISYNRFRPIDSENPPRTNINGEFVIKHEMPDELFSFWVFPKENTLCVWRRLDPNSKYLEFTLKTGEYIELPSDWLYGGFTHEAIACNMTYARNSRIRFRLPDLQGKMVSLEDQQFKNKAVLVNICGSWCGGCCLEIPYLKDFKNKYHVQGLEIIGIAFERGSKEEQLKAVKEMADKYKFNYPLLFGGSKEKARVATVINGLELFGGYPTTIYIGRDGLVKHIQVGFCIQSEPHKEWQLKQMEDHIKSLLAR